MVLIALAIAAFTVLPEDCGSVYMLIFVIICGFPFGWMFSGIGCWALGRTWRRSHRTYLFLSLPLEYWGLIYFMVGLALIVPCLYYVAHYGF